MSVVIDLVSGNTTNENKIKNTTKNSKFHHGLSDLMRNIILKSYEYKPIAEVTYRIEAVEDIKINGGRV